MASSLLKFIQFKQDTVGARWDLYYLRDKDGHEVDFLVTLNCKVHWLIEVKTSEQSPAAGLRYYAQRLQPRESLQLVLNLDRPREQSGAKILPLAKWLEALPLQ